MSDKPKQARRPWLPDLKTVKRADIDHETNRMMDLLMLAGEYLVRQNVADARLDAELLLADMLGVARLDLYLQPERTLSDEEKEAFRALLIQRAEGEPVQYILGSVAFRELELSVRPGVLIPRPETERLVEAAIQFAPDGRWANVLEVGVGSGAIALSLLEEGAASRVIAVDISEQAIAVTRENAKALGFTADPDDPSHFVKPDGDLELFLLQADALDPNFHPEHAPFQLVISNPPYVTEGEYKLLPIHIREHEPKEALTSGEDGLDAHRALAAKLPDLLTKDGLFLGEIGRSQGRAARELHQGWASSVDIHLDLAGLDRIVAVRK